MAQSSFSGTPLSPADAAVEELETQRTIGLTRMERADPVETPPLEEVPSGPETVVRYEVEIGSMSEGLDGGQGVMEGAVEITEYVNEEYTNNVVVTSSVIVERETPLGLIEDRLLTATREALKRLAELSDEDLRTFLDRTKKDRDQAYRN